jgi:hypothetical protein
MTIQSRNTIRLRVTLVLPELFLPRPSDLFAEFSSEIASSCWQQPRCEERGCLVAGGSAAANLSLGDNRYFAPLAFAYALRGYFWMFAKGDVHHTSLVGRHGL